MDLVAFYVKLVQAGKLTIERVPEKWREAVIQALDVNQ